jgi:hypothetical protein
VKLSWLYLVRYASAMANVKKREVCTEKEMQFITVVGLIKILSFYFIMACFEPILGKDGS